jgi:hypothetical protein
MLVLHYNTYRKDAFIMGVVLTPKRATSQFATNEKLICDGIKKRVPRLCVPQTQVEIKRKKQPIEVYLWAIWKRKRDTGHCFMAAPCARHEVIRGSFVALRMR